MKTSKIKSALAAIVAGILPSAPLHAAQPAADGHRQVIVVSSPYLPKANREVGYRETTGLVLDGLNLGDTLTLLDGVRLDVVTQITIPEGEVFRKNPNARARAMASGLAELRQFFATEVAHPPEMEGVIHVPQALALCATHLRKPKQPITVILFGKAFYADADGVFNMVNGYVPSDEHVRVSSRQSVYGTTDKRGALQGVTAHYAYLHEAFEHAEHRDAVSRLWSLFVQNQQGTLASFAASPAVVFRRVRDGAQEPIMDVKLDENDRELVMRRVKHVPVDTSSTQTNRVRIGSTSKNQPSAEVSLVVAPHLRPITLPTNASVMIPTNSEIVTLVIPNTIQAGKQGIAIVWSVQGGKNRQGVDVDLHVKPSKSAVELFYQNKEAPGGTYLRDIVHAGGEEAYSESPRASFEYVELDADVSLRDTSVWLDLYRNDSREAVQGIIIVVTGGRVVQDTFEFPASSAGDQRSQAAQRGMDPNWVHINLCTLLDRE